MNTFDYLADKRPYEESIGQAAVRDASFFGRPRHDGPGGHRPGAWGPKWHIIGEDHPDRGEWWSACGKVFLLRATEDPATIRPDRRCQLNGCRQRWPDVGSTPATVERAPDGEAPAPDPKGATP